MSPRSKMARQAIQVSIKKLEDLAKELREESHQHSNEFGVDFSLDHLWMIPIVNKQPECSDTWEFEK